MNKHRHKYSQRCTVLETHRQKDELSLKKKEKLRCHRSQLIKVYHAKPHSDSLKQKPALTLLSKTVRETHVRWYPHSKCCNHFYFFIFFKLREKQEGKRRSSACVVCTTGLVPEDGEHRPGRPHGGGAAAVGHHQTSLHEVQRRHELLLLPRLPHRGHQGIVSL